MRLILDTNVLLDLVLQREPWVGQAAAALKAGVDYRVTRNEKDFHSSPVSIADPSTILALL